MTYIQSLAMPIFISATIYLTFGCQKKQSNSTMNMDGQGGEVTGGEVTGGEVTGGEITNTCVPSEMGRDRALEFLDLYCGECHQDPPQYGAPYSLVSFEEIILGEEGLRPLDRSVVRLLDGSMPPAGQPQPNHEEAQAFIDWASCNSGLQRMPNIGGFEVSKPVYRGPAAPPQESEILSLRVPSITVDANVKDQYNCYEFLGPSQGDQDRSILRIEPIIDDARVVHHIVLYEASGEVVDQGESDCGSGLGAGVYAWAPGQPALHFSEGGLITRAGQNYVLEIHYNNQAGYDDVNDTSGVRLYHTDLIEPQIDMMTLGPDGFTLPARSRTQVDGQCLIEEDLRVVAMMPHMHELGQSLVSTIVRADQNREDLITLNGWDFNYQLVYDGMDILLTSGDIIQTYCVFENPYERYRVYGPYTDDEMCYNFVYVTPPPQSKRCNEPLEESTPYMPGVCGPNDVASYSTPIVGSYREGNPPEVAGGELIYGNYKLINLDVWFETFDLGIAVVDDMLSYYDAQGGFTLMEDGSFALDLQGTAFLTSQQGANFMRDISINFGGPSFTNNGLGSLDLELTCPNEGSLTMSYETDGENLSLYLTFNDVVSGVQVMHFERVE
jgi:hypothetical protein